MTPQSTPHDISKAQSYHNRTMKFVQEFVATMKRRGYTREQVFDLIDEADVISPKD